jgi:beta-galactosidase
VTENRTAWNEDWEYRERVSVFQELGGATGAWRPVTLPHDALIGTERDPGAPRGDASGYFRGGAFEYRKTFAVDADQAGRRLLLEFGGVQRDAAVFVNGALAGQWPFGSSRFIVRIDPFTRFGEANEVRVECRTHLDSRWYAGAGIHRDVFLVSKPPVHLAHDGIAITTADVDDRRAIADVAVEVANASALTATPRVDVTLLGPDGAAVVHGTAPITLRPNETGTARLRLPVPGPALWSTEAPNLYTAEVALRETTAAEAPVAETERVGFGIRTLQVDAEQGLRINGEPVTLRGACIHADAGPLGIAAIARADERRIERLKAAGFNAIRISHQPAGPALLEACDRLGMLVMDEAFDMWTVAKADFDGAYAFPEWWRRDLAAMVAKDRNHPSVIMYSIGNEIPELGIPEGGRWSRLLAEHLRGLDPTRFVTNGVNGFVAAIDMVIAGMAQRRQAMADAGGNGDAAGVNGMMAQVADQMNMISAAPPVTARTEEAFAALDIAGMNYGDGRYEGDAELFPHRVIVGTETFPTRIAHNWSLVQRLPHVIGDFTWTGWDYLGEVGLGAVSYQDGQTAPSIAKPFPGLLAQTGDIDITGHRRPVSHYREIVFGLRAEPYLAVQRAEHHGVPQLRSPWAWSDAIASWTWEGHEGKPVTVEVYADADEVELLLDGEPVARAAVGADLPFLATLDVEYRPGELTAVAYRHGTETGRTALRTAGEALVLEAAADRDAIRADTTDLAYIDLTLTDGAGTVQPCRDRTVTVAVQGPAVLAALGSARPDNTESFADSSHRTYDGRALAVVRPTGPGAITVTATAEGCAPATVHLTAA